MGWSDAPLDGTFVPPFTMRPSLTFILSFCTDWDFFSFFRPKNILFIANVYLLLKFNLYCGHYKFKKKRDLYKSRNQILINGAQVYKFSTEFEKIFQIHSNYIAYISHIFFIFLIEIIPSLKKSSAIFKILPILTMAYKQITWNLVQPSRWDSPDLKIWLLRQDVVNASEQLCNI